MKTAQVVQQSNSTTSNGNKKKGKKTVQLANDKYLTLKMIMSTPGLVGFSTVVELPVTESIQGKMRGFESGKCLF